MANDRDIFTSEIYVNDKQAEDAVARMTERMAKLNAEYERLKTENGELHKDTLKKKKQIDSLQKSIDGVRKGVDNYAEAIKNLDGRSIDSLIKLKRQLNAEIKKLKPNTEEWIRLTKDYEKVEKRLKSLEGEYKAVSVEAGKAKLSFQAINDAFNKYWSMFDVAVRSITGISATFRQCAEDVAKLDDVYSDVMKTTGLTREEVVELNEELKKMDTRTSREALNNLARDAGKLGITGKENILGFVRAADQIQVALGEDLGEGAIRNLGKIADVLGYTDSMGIEKSLLSIGSAVNAVGQASTASVAYLVDFSQRLAGIGAQAGISAADIIGFASGLDQSAMKVEMAATAFQTFVTKLYEDPAKFADYANMEVEKFIELLNGDANTAIITILKNLKDKDGFGALVPIFKDMGVDGARATSVLAAMASNLDAITDAQALANVEFEKATSLSNEFATKNNNMQASLEKARKSFMDARIELGEKLNHIMLKSTNLTTYLVKALVNYGKEIKATVITLALLTAAIKASTIAHTAWNAVQKIGHALQATGKTISLALSVAYNNLTGNLGRAAAAQKLLNKTMNASVFGVIATAVAGLTFAIAHWVKKAHEANAAMDKMVEIDKRINEEFGESASRVQVLSDIVHNNNLEIDQRRIALNKLKEIVPGYHADLTEEGRLINDNTEALGSYLKNLEKVTRAKILEEEYTKATAAVLAAEKKKDDAANKRTDALIAANGNTTEMTSYTMQSTAGAYTVSNITPYGQAVRDEKDAIKDYNDALVVQAEIMGRIEKEHINIATSAQEAGSQENETVEEVKKANEFLSQTQFDLLEQRYALLTKKEKALIDKGYEALSSDEAQALKKRYDKIMASDSKLADKRYEAEKKALEANQRDKENIAKQQYANGEISEKQYQNRLREIKVEGLQEQLKLAQDKGKDATVIMQAILDAQIEAQKIANAEMEAIMKEQQDKADEEQKRWEQEQRELEEKMKRAEDVVAGLRKPKEVNNDEMALELRNLKELHDAKLISEEQFEEAKKQIRKKYASANLQEDLDNLNKYLSAANSLMSQASSFVSSLKNSELANAESNYQAELTAAGDNAEKREAIETRYEQRKLDIQKKYADVDMVINIAKAVAAGALAAVEAFAAAGGNPILGGVFAAIIAATTAAEVATIIAQRNAIKNASVSSSGSSAPSSGTRGMTGYAEGGYTEDHTTVTTIGERGTEWVAPHWMVRQNPTTFANLERYRRAGSGGRSGSMARGFADGGFTDNVSGKIAENAMTRADIEAAVEAAIVKSMQNGAIRAYLVRNDLTELDAQTNRFKKQTSR